MKTKEHFGHTGPKRPRKIVAALLCGMAAILILASSSFSSQLIPSTQPAPPPQPPVDREVSETAFLEAYDLFLENRLWSAIDKLVEAQRANVYFIDTYYMRSLALRRLGRYPEAIEAMASYLEVRRNDPRAAIILNTMREEWEIVRGTLDAPAVQAQYFFRAQSLRELFGVSAYSLSSLRGLQGLGKMSASGNDIVICDTYGDKILFFDAASAVKRSAYAELAIENPVVVLPVSPGEALIFQKSGAVSRVNTRFVERTPTVEQIGAVAANVSDAEMIDSTMMAVADRTGLTVRFYGLPSFGETAEWRPTAEQDGDNLFEPVALAAFGNYLAVADRGNGAVYTLDTRTISVVDRFEIEAPRDLQWGNQGELYVLSENGTLYSRYRIPSPDARLDVVVEGLTEAWCMSWGHHGPLIADVTGRTWWSSDVNPGHAESIGAMTLYSPWIEERDDAEMLMMRAIVSSFFHEFIQDRRPDTQAVWRNEVRPSRVVETNPGTQGRIFYYSPSSGESTPNASISLAVTVDDVMADLARASRAGEEMPKVLVLDTRIAANPDQLLPLYAFLLQQGVRLDLWAIGRPPSPELASISRITLGYTYYSRVLDAVRFNNSYEWIVSIPLPPDTFTFGYPSEATLSIFATIDVIRFTDWMPVWPSLMKRTR